MQNLLEGKNIINEIKDCNAFSDCDYLFSSESDELLDSENYFLCDPLRSNHGSTVQMNMASQQSIINMHGSQNNHGSNKDISKEAISVCHKPLKVLSWKDITLQELTELSEYEVTHNVHQDIAKLTMDNISSNPGRTFYNQDEKKSPKNSFQESYDVTVSENDSQLTAIEMIASSQENYKSSTMIFVSQEDGMMDEKMIISSQESNSGETMIVSSQENSEGETMIISSQESSDSQKMIISSQESSEDQKMSVSSQESSETMKMVISSQESLQSQKMIVSSTESCGNELKKVLSRENSKDLSGLFTIHEIFGSQMLHTSSHESSGREILTVPCNKKSNMHKQIFLRRCQENFDKFSSHSSKLRKRQKSNKYYLKPRKYLKLEMDCLNPHKF